jgi:hypothetical protein
MFLGSIILYHDEWMNLVELSTEENEFLKRKENCDQRIDAEDNGGYQNYSEYHVKTNGNSPLL